MINDADIEMAEAAEASDEIAALNRDTGLRQYNADTDSKLVDSLAVDAYMSYGSAVRDLIGYAADHGIRLDIDTDSDVILKALDAAKRTWERRDRGEA